MGMNPNAAPISEEHLERQRGKRDNLALLYQGFLTGIVRLQARRQQLGDPEAFRDRMKSALRDVQREATALGYATEDIEGAEFAIVATLDEVILACDEPGRQQWAKRTLAVDLYDEAAAGDVFFEKLESLKTRRSTQQLADLLEVYVLCLLLGFEGRHTGRKGEIHAAIDWAVRRIEAIRQPDARITPQAMPSGHLTPAPVVSPASIPPILANWRRAVLLIVGATVAIFTLAYLALRSNVGEVAALAGR
jgi:type VI secretion system protein ImpK